MQSPKCTSNNPRVVLLPQLARWNWYFYCAQGICIKGTIHAVSPQQGWEGIINQSQYSKLHCCWPFAQLSFTLCGVIPPPNRVATSIFGWDLAGISEAKTMEQKWTPCSALHCAEAIYSSSHNGLLYWVSTLAWSAVLEGKFWRES